MSTIIDKPLNPLDVPYVTAFMISITPTIQESSKVKLAQVGDAKITESKMDARLSEVEDVASREDAARRVSPPRSVFAGGVTN